MVGTPTGFTPFGGFFTRGAMRSRRRPEQALNDQEAASIAVQHAVSKDDAKYDSMTDAQRQAYYLRPSRFSRLMKWVKG